MGPAPDEPGCDPELLAFRGQIARAARRLDAERSAQWNAASMQERADALLDALGLVDAFPHAGPQARTQLPAPLRPGANPW